LDRLEVVVGVGVVVAAQAAHEVLHGGRGEDEHARLAVVQDLEF